LDLYSIGEEEENTPKSKSITLKRIMKKILILLFVLIGLGAMAYLLKPEDKGAKTSLSTTDRDFAFPEAKMGKVTIQKKGEEMQSFERKGGSWYINEKYKVGDHTIPQLTTTLSKIAIQNIPSKKETILMLKDLEDNGIYVRIYDLEGNLAKSYTIGLESLDESGTAFLMDGAKQPYNMYLRGYETEIRSRLLHSIDEWRDKSLFDHKANDIKEIAIKYHKDQKSSFKLEINGGDYKVAPLSKFMTASNAPINKNRVNAYLGEFEKLYAENLDNENIRRDSIAQLVPWATVAIMTNDGNINEMDFFPFQDLVLKFVNTKEAKEANKIERFFVNKKDHSDFYVAQNRVLRRIFRDYQFFLE